MEPLLDSFMWQLKSFYLPGLLIKRLIFKLLLYLRNCYSNIFYGSFFMMGWVFNAGFKLFRVLFIFFFYFVNHHKQVSEEVA